MIFTPVSCHSFFTRLRSSFLIVTAPALLTASVFAQVNPTVPTAPPTTTISADGAVQTTTQTTTDASGKPVQSVTSTMTLHRGKKKASDKDGKVVQTKDTKRAVKKDKTAAALVGVDAKLPDKQLYDKAVIAMNKGHFDVARLDLQTMLNTYPDSQYQMRAKLAIADSWYKEGGTAALTQAESEYADFRVFFPNAPEAAEAQMRIGDIYFRQMDKPDRDYAKATHAEEEYRRMLTDYPNADPKLTDQAKQRLREVQEVMASREADIASYYAAKENWAAAIARYQTVVDQYPLYSHMDDTLIGLGDAYEAQARFIRGDEGSGGRQGEAGGDVRRLGGRAVSQGGAGALGRAACGGCAGSPGCDAPAHSDAERGAGGGERCAGEQPEYVYDCKPRAGAADAHSRHSVGAPAGGANAGGCESDLCAHDHQAGQLGFCGSIYASRRAGSGECSCARGCSRGSSCFGLSACRTCRGSAGLQSGKRRGGLWGRDAEHDDDSSGRSDERWRRQSDWRCGDTRVYSACRQTRSDRRVEACRPGKHRSPSSCGEAGCGTRPVERHCAWGQDCTGAGGSGEGQGAQACVRQGGRVLEQAQEEEGAEEA